MRDSFRFAIISDPHVALPHTIWNHPDRFHLVEVSIPTLEVILERLSQLELDCLLLPGDLTQHGEIENHRWLAHRLAQLPYPVYLVPGNHDVPQIEGNTQRIGLADFSRYYSNFGYADPNQLYYTAELQPGLRLIGLNSNYFDASGDQIGYLDAEQLEWLRQTLAQAPQDFHLVMIHHNLVEHLPGQSTHPLGRRYMLSNAPQVRSVLQEFGVQLVFTGHLHAQDIACENGLYDITTGSLVSYPHPYRILELSRGNQGNRWLQIESGRVQAIPGWDTLQTTSRNFLGSRSLPFMLQLLTNPPVSLPMEEAKALAPKLEYFWADIADGDAMFDFSHFPPIARQYFESFGAVNQNGYWYFIDNHITLALESTK
jgi:3',5'-cyclic AMP phosphodiesterase CpdA